MKYIVQVLFLMLITVCSPAQEAAVKGFTDLTSREKPQYPGGEKELRKYLSLNLHYPNRAMDQKIQGEVVVGFMIDEDGQISNIKTLKSIGHGCDEEAERVVRNMPRWSPASSGGKGIRVSYTLPVVFELPDDVRKKGN